MRELGSPSAGGTLESHYNLARQGRKSLSSCRISQGFDSVAKHPECTDHSRSASSPRLFAHRGAAFLIANPSMQNYPNQLTQAMRNNADGFVVSETRHETTIDDLEDASFVFDGSIGSLIENTCASDGCPWASVCCGSRLRSLLLPGMLLPTRPDSWRRKRLLPWHPLRQ